jgi:hypothetical protein
MHLRVSSPQKLEIGTVSVSEGSTTLLVFFSFHVLAHPFFKYNRILGADI